MDQVNFTILWRTSCSRKRVSWEILDLFRDAAEENGIPKIDEFNTGNNFGSSYFQMNQKWGQMETENVFLAIIKNRKNLTIYKETTVAKINYLKKITKTKLNQFQSLIKFTKKK